MVEIDRVTAQNATEALEDLRLVYRRDIDEAGLHRAASNPDFLLLIARTAAGPAGYVHGAVLDRVDGRRMLLIYDLEVVQGARRAGVGTALFEAAREVGRKHGTSETWLVTEPDNHRAIGFYETLRGEPFPAVGYQWAEK